MQTFTVMTSVGL